MRARLHYLAAFVVLTFCALHPHSAKAQASPTATGPGSSLRLGGGVTGYYIGYGQRYLGGAQAWVDANPYWRWGLEGEVRWLRYNQDLGAHATTYLAGPRISLLPTRVEPYVKVLAGSGHFDFPYDYARGDYLVVAAGGGVDLHLGSRLEVRVIDVEYQRWPQFSFGPMPSYGISAGLSYTIHRSETWRVR